MTRTCDTCQHSRPHTAQYVECDLARRLYGNAVSLYCLPTARCSFDGGWEPRSAPQERPPAEVRV